MTLSEFKEYQEGRAAACEQMDQPDFDVQWAIHSFKNDPADSPFQHGYLRQLEEAISGHA